MSSESFPALSNRMILLGASNLTLSLRLVIQSLQLQLSEPGEIFAAVGHGRAYSVDSEMLFRGLPGIADCGLWRQLEVSEKKPAVALLTDIGNDIMYEAPSAKILLAVEWCVRQLHNHSAQIVMTNLPMASIEGLAERRYIFFRNLFYPFCRLSRVETVSRARTIHAGLIEMAARYQFKLIESEPRWFGADGIHVRYGQRSDYYRSVLSGLSSVDRKSESHDDNRMSLRFWQQRATFASKTILGREIVCPQPSGLLIDGSRVFKY
ncbi:hypothetical protein [Nitrosomonas sp.]|uniref:hypothetical protein n=1 Tax=Nitrosomonas sp. TaxID=42353 RepID=UPI001DA4C6E2|nr:hypothetical protein [Nitrosomonas sp.]MBX3618087.1 hypothetical protein [Nitrosomonas sp.]